MKKATENPAVCPVCRSGDLREDFTCTDYFVTGENFPVYQCNDCGFRLTGAAPSPQETGRYYHSEAYISHSDTRKGLVNRIYHLVREVMLRQKSKIINKHTAVKTGTILDIGAGTGYFLRHMQKQGWKVTGTEKSDDARHFATTEWNLNLKPDDDLFTLPDHSYDVITLWHVLEHLDDPGAYLQKISVLLKPSGILVIAVPNPESTDAVHYRKFWAAWDVPRHLWHFTPANLKQMIEKRGFLLKKTFRMPFDAFYVSILSEQYKNNKGTDLSKRNRFLNLLKGLFWGKISWIVSLFRPLRCSSLIYLCNLKS